MSSDSDKFKKRVFEVIQIGNRSDVLSCVFDVFISVLIVSIIVITFALTFDIDEKLRQALRAAELAITCLFTAEYLLRLWTSEFLYEDNNILRYIFSFNGIIDLLTIVSFLIPEYGGVVALRMIRVLRIMRLFQVNRSFDAFNVIAAVLKSKKNQLLSSMSIVFILILMSSISMYSFEHEAQPYTFANGFSGIWWAVSAILTIGYGDIYPITAGGKICAVIMSLLGVCAAAVPTGIISAGFVEYYSNLDTSGIEPELLEEAREKNVDINAVLRNYLKTKSVNKKKRKK